MSWLNPILKVLHPSTKLKPNLSFCKSPIPTYRVVLDKPSTPHPGWGDRNYDTTFFVLHWLVNKFISLTGLISFFSLVSDMYKCIRDCLLNFYVYVRHLFACDWYVSYCLCSILKNKLNYLNWIILFFKFVLWISFLMKKLMYKVWSFWLFETNSKIQRQVYNGPQEVKFISAKQKNRKMHKSCIIYA